MGTTPLHGLRYPAGGDAVSLATYYQNLANDVDTSLPVVSTSTPTAKSGIVWYNPTTDLTQIYTGTGWTPVVGSSAWTVYTPVLTAQTTNPSLGTSTLTGGYDQVRKTVNWRATLTVASGFAAGSGYYILSLPVTAWGGGAANEPVGTAVGYNAVGYGRYAFTPVLTNANSVIFALDGGVLSQAGVNAVAWATGHTLAVYGMYQAA